MEARFLKEKETSNWKFIVELVALFVVVFAATAALMTFVLSKDQVNGPSMEPGLQNNDRLFSLRHKQIKRNEIVVLYAPDKASNEFLKKNNATDADISQHNGNLYLNGKVIPKKDHELYIKRVIGMPGDTVSSKNDKLYVNGKRQAEPYLKKSFIKKELQQYATSYGTGVSGMKFTNDFTLKTQASTHRSTVPKGSYFVMGDNRFVSHDGRAFGFIKKSDIQSVVVLRYWPLNKFKIY